MRPRLAQLCRSLDGLPLALELAAAGVKVLSPQQLAARLDDRFKLLVRGSRTAPVRQQTLESAVAWSYDLLDPPTSACSTDCPHLPLVFRWTPRRRYVTWRRTACWKVWRIWWTNRWC